MQFYTWVSWFFKQTLAWFYWNGNGCCQNTTVSTKVISNDFFVKIILQASLSRSWICLNYNHILILKAGLDSWKTKKMMVFYHPIIFETQTIDFLMVVVKRNRNYHAKSMLVNLTRSNYVGKKRFSWPNKKFPNALKAKNSIIKSGVAYTS